MQRKLVPIGARFGFWTVVAGPIVLTGDSRARTRYLCRCRCSTERVQRAEVLLKHLTVSCGCFDPYRPQRTREKHRLTYTVEYKAWVQMRARCNRKSHAAFRYYGARGIRVCDEWNHSFEAFVRDVGVRPSPDHSIDRIDNDGDYAPDNVRWSTDLEQMRNRRNTARYTYNGQTLTLEEWGARIGVSRGTLQQRIVKAKWPLQRALSEPSHR